MKTELARVVALGAAAIVTIGLVAGCAPATVTPKAGHGKSTASASSPTPTATAKTSTPAGLPAGALFQITAKAVQANGATMDVVQTVYAPAAATASDTALLNQQCTANGTPWQSNFASGYQIMYSTISATAEPGTATFNTQTTAPMSFGATTSIAYTGDFQTFEAYCSPGLVVFPGTSHGVAAVSSDPTTINGWAYPGGTYGFIADGNSPIESDSLGPTVMQDCTVQVSAAAIAIAPTLSGWATQPYVQANGCVYKV